jgi:RNA polymerase sigma-70 factor, ECF subfamily
MAKDCGPRPNGLPSFTSPRAVALLLLPGLVLDNRGHSELFPTKCFLRGKKTAAWRFNHVDVSGTAPQIDSFEELAMPLFGQLYNFAHWLTQNREEAEDLIQETYVKSLKRFSSFQLGTNLRAWMYRILRNTFLTSRTGLRATMTVPLDPEEDGPELAVENHTPETILINRANSELVQAAISDLPIHYREAILLCEVEEMSYQEIAETFPSPLAP